MSNTKDNPEARAAAFLDAYSHDMIQAVDIDQVLALTAAVDMAKEAQARFDADLETDLPGDMAIPSSERSFAMWRRDTLGSQARFARDMAVNVAAGLFPIQARSDLAAALRKVHRLRGTGEFCQAELTARAALVLIDETMKGPVDA